jgi:UDP-N-acetylmuramoylalanine--D-glutamate ligase
MKRLRGVSGQAVAVIGSGESGVASAKLLLKAGAVVRISSSGPIPEPFKRWCAKHRVLMEAGEHTADFLSGAKILVVSPGVKPSSFPIRHARRHGIPVWSEIELAWRMTSGKFVAVTGTNGKTTTCTLLWEIIRRHHDCHLCGNIGNSLAASVLEKGAATWRVVEVSSFQMKYISRFRPDAAVVLNLSPNHLDWHPHLADYYQSKLRIAECLTPRQTLILNHDDATLVRRTTKLRARKVNFGLKKLRDGITIAGDHIREVQNGILQPQPVASLKHYRLKGAHNLQNALAATAAALALGVSKKAIQAGLDAMKPLPHRVEDLGEAGGVRFVNDSKSTTAMSTVAAIRRFDSGVVLLAGGRRKQKSFQAVFGEVRRRVRRIVFYGEAGESMLKEFGFFKNRTVVRDFEGAVREAYRAAGPGQVLLLSPMCSSFDQFSSYRERGDAFRRIYGELAGKG